ncbi:MAG: universal stress protein [Nitrososphaerales archaeon]
MPSDKMRIPKKILVAVDGSEDGYKAADYAIALAANLQSVILFLYVAGASSARDAERQIEVLKRTKMKQYQ